MENPNEVSHLKETTKLRFKSISKALKLQAKETERRLGILNGEAERLHLMQMSYIPREVYDANLKELNSKISSLQKIIYIGIGIILVIEVIFNILNIDIKL